MKTYLVYAADDSRLGKYVSANECDDPPTDKDYDCLPSDLTRGPFLIWASNARQAAFLFQAQLPACDEYQDASILV